MPPARCKFRLPQKRERSVRPYGMAQDAARCVRRDRPMTMAVAMTFPEL